MTLRTRFTLIGIGILIFAVLAPTAVMLARGYVFDFEEKKFIKTGAIVVKSEPRGASVLLDGKKIGTTPLSKRFLKPGRYRLRITKNGYYSWEKDITVHEQLVTNVPEEKDKVDLLLSGSVTLELATSTLDFFSENSKTYVLKTDQILEIGNGSSGPGKLFATSTPVFENAKILDVVTGFSGNPRFLLSRGQAHLIVEKDSIIELGPNHQNPQIAANQNKFYSLIDSALTEQDFQGQLSIVHEKVAAYDAKNGLYYISASSTPQFIQIAPGKQDRVLLSNLPQAREIRILVSPDKQIFALLESDLYQIADSLEKINGNVKFFKWNSQKKYLIYGNDHEIWVFDRLSGNGNVLVTRTSEKIGKVELNAKTGYIFISTGTQIKAIEFDKSGQPNTYTLIETQTPNTKFAVNPAGTNLIYFDGETLFSLKIR